MVCISVSRDSGKRKEMSKLFSCDYDHYDVKCRGNMNYEEMDAERSIEKNYAFRLL